MTHNQFQKLLNEYNIDPKLAHLFSLLFEMISDTNKQQDQTGKLLLGFAKQLEGFVQLSEATNKKIVALATGRYRTEGVDVQSVGYSPEEIEKNRKN